MKFSVVTIFPQVIQEFVRWGLIEKAIRKGLISVDVYDLRDYSANKHRKVDDRPLGGGAGMVLMPGPLFSSVEAIGQVQRGRVILFSAYGKTLTQERFKKFSVDEHLILICGRYEGVDQRFIDQLVDEEISLGEYVLMGGEVAAEAMIEGVSRMIPGVVANPESVEGDSFFHENQIAFPQYTQPRTFRNMAIPEVLLSGNHEEIRKWRSLHRRRRRSNG